MLNPELSFESIAGEMDDLAAVVERRSGIVFAGARREELATRVREHMAARRFAAVPDLLRVVRFSGAEYDELLDRLLVTPTAFFEPRANFEVFENRVLPELRMKKFWDKPRSLRIWSAGCGSGEEPYSIALSVAETLDTADWNFHVVATDASRVALQHAERGVYAREKLAALSATEIEVWFMRAGELLMVRPKLRNLVSFTRGNLAEPAYIGRFDCIFCVGVLPYLSSERAGQLMQRFHECLEPGGYLFIGLNEELPASTARLERVEHSGAAIYRKREGGRRSFGAEMPV